MAFMKTFKHSLYYKKWFLMPKTKATIKIQNVVASGTLNQKVDLNAIVKSSPSVEYRPEQFPGLVFRLKKPKTATLIFSSGKMVCTGARSVKESRRAIMKVVKELKKGGIIILRKPRVKAVNIVASASLGGNVDLEKTVVMLRKAMYEPEQFPGLIYRMDEPKVVILIFASGNLVCTGAKKEQDVYDAVHKLHASLEEQSLIFYE
jgi:transcription initiation factor TFIID TATA-box-binding protein